MLLICGMHRSGTSAVAAVIERLGLNLGIRSGYKAVEEVEDENPNGFFEHIPLSIINREILFHSDTFPGDLPRERLDSLANAARNIIHRENIQAFKDPRSTILTHFWNETLRGIPGIVKTFRPPEEIGASLQERGSCSMNEGIVIANRYEENFWADTSGLNIPTFVVPYRELVQQPSFVTRKLYDFLLANDFPVKKKIDCDLAAAAINPGLHHKRLVNYSPTWFRTVNVGGDYSRGRNPSPPTMAAPKEMIPRG